VNAVIGSTCRRQTLRSRDDVGEFGEQELQQVAGVEGADVDAGWRVEAEPLHAMVDAPERHGLALKVPEHGS